jgi:hypothetical protein
MKSNKNLKINFLHEKKDIPSKADMKNIKLLHKLETFTKIDSIVFTNSSPKLMIDYSNSKGSNSYYYFTQYLKDMSGNTIDKTDFIVKESGESVIEKNVELNGKAFKMINRYRFKNGTDENRDAEIIISVNTEIENEFFMRTRADMMNSDNKISVFIEGNKYVLDTVFIKKIESINRRDFI